MESLAALIDNLRSDSLATRDGASGEAKSIPAQSIAGLLDGLEDRPGSEQARVLYTFAGALLHNQSARLEAGGRAEVSVRGQVSSALGQLTETFPVLFEPRLVGPDSDVEIDGWFTALGLLDAICARAGLGWTVGRYGDLSVTAAEPIAGPRAYDGPLRTRITSASLEGTTDFVASKRTARLRIASDFEWPLNPLSAPSLKVRSLVAGDRSIDGRVDADSGEGFFCAMELPPAVWAMDRVEVELAAVFPSGFIDVVADDPAVGDSFETSGFAVRIDEVKSDGYLVNVSSRGIEHAQLSQSMLRGAVSEVVLGINESGEEALAQTSTITAARRKDSDPGLKLRFTFGRAGFGKPVALRFRLTEGALVSAYPLAFGRFELP